MKNSFNIKKITGLGAITSFALISFIIESLFPPIFIPGSKMGLSNIFVLLALILYGNIESILVVIIKCVLGCVFTGNISALLYSLSAGIVSALIQIMLVKFIVPKVSIIAVSVISAVIHNIVQNIVYALITSPLVMVYLPYLAIIGIISGLIVGTTTFYIIKYLPHNLVNKYIDL